MKPLSHRLAAFKAGKYQPPFTSPDYSSRWGVVYMLPHGRYIAAMVDPWNWCKEGSGPCIVECKPNGEPFTYKDKDEAARAADDLAEHYAESAREEGRLQSEILQHEESMEYNKRAMDEARSEARSLLSEIRASTLSPGLCERMKGEVRDLRATMHRAFREICQAKQTLATLNQ